MSEMFKCFQSKRKGRVSRLDFWFVGNLKFERIATQIKEEFKAIEIVEDSENVYEWLEFVSDDQRYFNFSWKYQEPVRLVSNPFHLFVEDSFFEQDFVDYVGISLARIICNPVYFGTVKYVSGDDYEYTTKKIFQIGIES